MLVAYKDLAKKQSKHQLEILRTYNGGEYVNQKFTTYFIAQGIKMQHTIPYTPWNNGVDKWKNHTLKEMEKCMIQFKGLSLHFCVEAITFTNYILNHTSTKDLKNITL